MDFNFRINDIANVIYVDKTEYTAKETTFGHVLKYYELIYKITGETILHFGNTVTNLVPGTIYLLPKGDNKLYHVERIVHGDCIDIFFSVDSQISSELFVQNVSDNKKIEALFKKIFSIWVAKNDGYYFECLSILYKVFAELQKKQYVPNDKLRLIKPAIDYINENFISENIDCVKLAELCGLSYSYLKQIFVKQYNMSPHRYIINLKINYACDLLMQHTYTVSQVAEMSGFTDIYYFSRFFKKHIGITPTEYILKYLSSK